MGSNRRQKYLKKEHIEKSNLIFENRYNKRGIINEQYFEDELRFILNLNKGFKPELSHIEYNPNLEEFNTPFIIPYVLFEIDGHAFIQVLFFFIELFFYKVEVF